MFMLFADFGCTESDEHCRRDKQEPENNGLNNTVGKVCNCDDIRKGDGCSGEEVRQCGRFVFVGFVGHKFNLESAAATAGSVFATARAVAEADPASAGDDSVRRPVAPGDFERMLGVFALHASGAVRAFNFPDSSSATQVAGASRDIGGATSAACRKLVVHMYEWMRQGDRTPAEVLSVKNNAQ